jgi:hypothetical protein
VTPGTEIKHLRARVDAFPTGPLQGVAGIAAGLQTSDHAQEPSSRSSSSEEEMEDDKQTALPCIPQVARHPCSTPGDQHIVGKPSGFRDGVLSCARLETCFFGVLPSTAGEPLLELAQLLTSTSPSIIL